LNLDTLLGLGRAAAEADGLVAGLYDVAVVGQAVEQRGGHLGVAEAARPFAEVQVGGDHHAGVLVQPVEQVEQQRPAGLAERQGTQLIEDEQVHAQQEGGDVPGLALGLLLLQCIDQVDGGVEPRPLAVTGDARDADGRGQVRLAGARPTDQQRVVRVVGEGGGGQGGHPIAVHRRDLEVEAGQVPVHGKLRHMHLVADRAHRTVGGLGLQQVLDEPARGLDAGAAPLLDQIGPGAGRAVLAQRSRFDQHIRLQGRPPRWCRHRRRHHRDADGHSVRCRQCRRAGPSRASAAPDRRRWQEPEHKPCRRVLQSAAQRDGRGKPVVAGQSSQRCIETPLWLVPGAPKGLHAPRCGDGSSSSDGS
jgi:hypothetical protein